MRLELVPASTLEGAQLAKLFTEGYGEYVVPISIDEARLRWMVHSWDLDLEASRIAFADDEPVGLAMLGLRAGEAWIGGLGVVPSMRRRKLGERLMVAVLNEARARGVAVARLEVICENEGAIALYERLGFERARDLEVWSLPGAAGPLADAPVASARRTIVDRRATREPWQRADGTVDNLDDVAGLVSGDAAAIVRVADGRVHLLQAAGPDDDLLEVVRAAAALGDSLHALNVDPADPLASALAAAGGRVDVRQHELALPLA
jgi:ribosomal protein S18 acetylase RimI-like enzyme